jgi:hypothetical protein
MTADAKCPRCNSWECRCDFVCARCAGGELAGREVYSLSKVKLTLICGGCLTADEALRARLTPQQMRQRGKARPTALSRKVQLALAAPKPKKKK